jgi:hypothetical protein
MMKKSVAFLMAVTFFWVCLAATASAYKDCSTACDPKKCCEDNYREAVNNPPTWKNVVEYLLYGTTPDCVDTCITGCFATVIITAALCYIAGGTPEACMALGFVGYIGCNMVCLLNCQQQ